MTRVGEDDPRILSATEGANTAFAVEPRPQLVRHERPRLREVCTDCSRQSGEHCPYRSTTCSDCSFMRERAMAGRPGPIPDCPAHGHHLEDVE